MQRKSWNSGRLERLSAALKKAGNTPEAFNAMMEFEELLPLEAQELSEQIRWPNPPKELWGASSITPEYLAEQRAENQRRSASLKTLLPSAPPITIKRFDPPAAPPKIVIKRY